MKFINITLAIISILFSFGAHSSELSGDASGIQPDNFFPKVKLETSLGTIVVELDRIKAPITSNNFLAYTVAGSYDSTIFHRVIEGFVVQGGGYDILYHPRKERAPIFNESGNGLKNETYTLAMARLAKPHSATNQFYFNMEDNESLDPGRNWGYTVFGVVVEGTEILDLISRVQTHIEPQLGWEDVPVKQVLVKKVTIMDEE